jgi:hypothetical protein
MAPAPANMVKRLAVAALGLLLVASDARAAEYLTPAARAFVFDGTTVPGAVYVIDFTGEEGQTAAAALSLPGVLLLDPALHPGLPIPIPPPDPPPLADDCEALDHGDAVEAFLDGAEQFASAIAAGVEACAAEVHRLAEEALARIRSAEPHPERFLCDVTSMSYVFAERGRRADTSFGCTECTSTLSNVSQRMTAVARYASQCQRLRADLEEIRDRVAAELDSGGLSAAMACLGRVPSPLEVLADPADDLARAARRDEAALGADRPLCSASNLEASCAQCAGGGIDIEEAPAAVLQVPGGPALGAVVGALHSAANLAEDGAVAHQLADLAARLRWVPRPLVRRIAFPARVPDTVDLIAVRSPIPDARPQVFVLSAVPEQLLP